MRSKLIHLIFLTAFFGFIGSGAVFGGSTFNGLKIGSQAPDFILRDYSPLEREVQLSSFKGKKVVVVQFGSSTAWPYVREIGAVNKLAKQYKGRVEFLTVYTKEADKDWQPETYSERRQRAKGLQFAYVLQSRQRIKSKVLIDELDDKVAKAYGQPLAGAFVIDKDGKIAYMSERVNAKEIEKTLASLLR